MVPLAREARVWHPTVFDPSLDLAPLEELHAELAAVRTQIERTDRLIDQVVYRLYGLTEEEIALVERSGQAAVVCDIISSNTH